MKTVIVKMVITMPDESYISEDILEEIKKCKESPWYFATKYLIVKNHNNQSVPFRTPLSEEEFNKFIANDKI